jgi:DNA invertase Pin-like site-specific DNA recombinase
VEALEEFHSLGIDFVSHQEALDTSPRMGRMVFTVIAAMAELERAIIRERVVAGLDHAQRNGTKSGKPVGRPRVIVDADKFVQLRDIEHLPWPEIGRRTRSSSGTVRRIYAAAVTRLQSGQYPMGEAL